MLSVPFEIKVALLGHVSVGKTTVLNALFREKFAEVSPRRTTAGINHYRISPLSKHADNEVSDDASETAYMTADNAFEENTSDNRSLRDSNILQEKIFDIELDDPICEMRNDTRLVVVDVPGLNEARTENMYLDYVKKSWDSFDCVVVVMDAMTGVNTEEKVKLLEFVKENLEAQKEVPVIILCNKVDDMEDEDITVLVDEVRKEVEKIFGVEDRSQALASLPSRDPTDDIPFRARQSEYSPVFIPMCAEWAFLYRTIANADTEALKSLPQKTLDRVGQVEVGVPRWKKLSPEAKVQVILQIAQDRDSHESRLAETNFDKFLEALQHFLHKQVQAEILQKQLDVALEKAEAAEGAFVDYLISIFDRSVALGTNDSIVASAVKETFWRLWKKLTERVFQNLSYSPDNVDKVHLPMKELIRFSQQLHMRLYKSGDADIIQKKLDQEKAIDAMSKLIKRQVGVVLQKEVEWRNHVGWMDGVTVPSRMNRNTNYYSHHYSSKVSSWRWDSQEACWVNQNNSLQLRDTDPSGDKPEHWTWQGGSWRHNVTGAVRCLPQDQNPATFSGSTWETLSPRDWHTIISSILCLRSDALFCDHFSAQIVSLEWISGHGKFNKPHPCTRGCVARSGRCSCESPETRLTNSLNGRYDSNGDFVPSNKENFKKVCKVRFPERLSSPEHWGHLGWLYCGYMSTVSDSDSEKMGSQLQE